MPRPFKGGKKKSRGKRVRIKKGPLILKDETESGSQLYGIIKQRLGGKPAYVLVKCEDGIERRCVIRGKFTKRVWMNPDDIVLINYNKDSDDKKGEVEVKYNPMEVNKLKELNKLPSILFDDEDEESNITFGEASSAPVSSAVESYKPLEGGDDSFFDIDDI